MNKEVNKIKNSLFKGVALLIALCYLIEPAQNELRHVFHFLLHSLEPHNQIVLEDIDEDQMLLMASERRTEEYNHEILNLFDKIFNSGSEDNNYPGKFKNDVWSAKKIVVKQDYSAFINRFMSPPRIDNFKIIRFLQYKRHFQKLDRPPQLLSAA